MVSTANRFANNASTGGLFDDPDGTGSGFGASRVALLAGQPDITVANLFFIP